MTHPVPPPPEAFAAIRVVAYPETTVLHRNHARAFGSAEFNPCKGQPSRFAPFVDRVTGACVSTLYAATSREAAAYETVFHDIEASAAFKTVPLDLVEARTLSTIRSRRVLHLATLFAPELKAWGLERRNLIDTPKSTYAAAVRWAEALHAARADIDGLVWTSRQCDPDLCIVLFGDRVQHDDLVATARQDVAHDAMVLLELRAFGKRAGIVLIS